MPHMPVHPFAGPRLCDVPSFEDVQGLLVACWFLKAFPCCFLVSGCENIWFQKALAGWC